MSEPLYRMVGRDVPNPDAGKDGEPETIRVSERVPMEPDEESATHAERAATIKAKEANAYAEARRAEYPSVADQLDAMWKGGAAMDEMRKRVQSVKDANPKPDAAVVEAKPT